MRASRLPATTPVQVILPVHCGRAWVFESIDSVLAQTHCNLQLTVVDDACPERTLEAVRERYGERDERLFWLALPERRGAAAARMAAARTSSAPLLAFIDQDDRWHPEKLARQLARLDAAPQLAGVHTDVVIIDAQGAPAPQTADLENTRRAQIAWERLPAAELARECFRRISIRLVSALVRRDAFDALGGFDARFFGGEEWSFWVRLAASGRRLGHLAEPLVERRVHAGNTSVVEVERRRHGQLAAVEDLLAQHPELRDLADELRGSILRTEVMTKLRTGRGRAAREPLRLLRGYRPRSPETTALWLLSFAGPLLRPAAAGLEALSARVSRWRP